MSLLSVSPELQHVLGALCQLDSQLWDRIKRVSFASAANAMIMGKQAELERSLEAGDIAPVVHQTPFYGNPADVPERHTVWAGTHPCHPVPVPWRLHDTSCSLSAVAQFTGEGLSPVMKLLRALRFIM